VNSIPNKDGLDALDGLDGLASLDGLDGLEDWRIGFPPPALRTTPASGGQSRCLDGLKMVILKPQGKVDRKIVLRFRCLSN